MKPGKIVQLFGYQGIILCLTEEGCIFRFNPTDYTYEYISEGIPQ